MGTWMNNDGLYIKYGTDEATAGKAGAFGDVESGQHVIEVNIPDVTVLSTSETYILDDNTFVPAGMFVQKVEVIATTALTGANALLCIGLIRRDRSTAYDADGFVIDAPVADFAAAGNIVTYTQGSDEHGALIGTTLANSGYLVAFEGDANAFTAGALKIRVYLQKI